MKQPNETPDDGWDHGWEEHRSRQLARTAKLSFVEKLEWLEQAQEFGEFLLAQGKKAKKSQE